MKVIVDDKIPYIREAIERIASDVIYLPGAKITKADLIDADAMIIRTRTPCDAALLEGTSIQFIATATIGFDHLDTAYLAKAGIPWSNCPGCNASSVGQYVHAAFLVLREQKGLDLAHLTVGIVGMGHVGKEVEKALRPFGCRILRNDPPRQEAEGGDFVSLHTLAEQCNVITFHTPLIFEGLHPTFHLADKEFFASLRHQPVILNAGRGEVVDNRAILYAMDKRLVSEAIIDTWENEPHVVTPLLERAFLATPHIAGYSADGKANATRMALQALCTHFDLNIPFTIVPPALPASFCPSPDADTRALQLYDPRTDSNALKAAPENFEYLRSHYPLRREAL